MEYTLAELAIMYTLCCYTTVTKVSTKSRTSQRFNDIQEWITPSNMHKMTGLNPSTDTILSLSCFVTDASLNLLDPHGFDAVIHHSESTIENMSAWCVEQHGRSGLSQACLDSTTSAEQAASDLLAYIKKHVGTPRTALLAGNSIHADKMFLMKPPWNVVLEFLHYRLFDVSAIKEAVRRWAPETVLNGVPKKELKHTAREDVLESIEEARYYQSFFVKMG